MEELQKITTLELIEAFGEALSSFRFQEPDTWDECIDDHGIDFREAFKRLIQQHKEQGYKIIDDIAD